MIDKNKNPIDANFEKRFQRANDDQRYERDMRLAEIGTQRTQRLLEKQGRRKTLRNRTLGVAAVGVTAAVTAVGMGHATVGDGVRQIFKDDSPIPTSPIQNEKQELSNLQKSGNLDGTP